MDEADVLSDRIGILKDGKLKACGSSLFLKHHFGVGYKLSFTSDKPFDMSSVVEGAVELPTERQGLYQWQLEHGSEPSFPRVLGELQSFGAHNVSVDLTTLEQVFLETGREDSDDTTEHNSADSLDDEDDESADIEDPEEKSTRLSRIWEPRGEANIPSSWKKFLIVQHFMMTNAMKIKDTIFINVVMPVSDENSPLRGFVLVAHYDPVFSSSM